MRLHVLFTSLLVSLLLITTGAAADKKSDGSALFEAVQFQDIPKIQKLIAGGADVNHMENSRPILGWASQNGNVQVVEELLKAGANPNVADIGFGHTPLMRAIDTQQVEIAKALLKAKADPNAKNAKGESCLMMAVVNRKPEIVSALIDAGADVQFVMKDGSSPALAAAEDNMPESMQILIMLGAAKANMNASNAAYTPLVYAISQGNKELIQILLGAGANPNLKTAADQYPIFRALDDKEMLKILLDAKADPNIVSAYGDTPLTTAIREGYTDSVSLLLESGADPLKADSNGTPPLQVAENSYRDDITAIVRAHLPGEASPQKSEKIEEYPTIAIVPVESDGTTCTIVDAARKQMEIHGLLQKQVDAGKMSSDIFRTFMVDTEEYGKLLVSNPAEACKLLERLRKKYGV